MCDSVGVTGRLGAAVALAVLVAALGVAASPTPPRSYFSWNAAHRIAHLTLLAGLGAGNNGFNFDGYGRGRLLVSVPVGWRVVVDCDNRGGYRHSCIAVRGSLALTPAFAGATSPHPVTGLSPGSKASFSFVASRVGTFRIASLVAGQEQARMYAVLEVTRGGRPSISARPGP